jgi:hypothetical protein
MENQLMRTRGAYLAILGVTILLMIVHQAPSTNFLRLRPLRLDFLDKRSELTVMPSVKLRGDGFATDVAAHLASSAKFRTFTSRASWRAPFWDRDVYAGRILSSTSSGLGCSGFLSCMLSRSYSRCSHAVQLLCSLKQQKPICIWD